MSSRAAIYDRVMNRSLENELLILMKRGAAFDLDALRVPKAQEEAPVSDVDDDSTLEPNGWVWRSVLVNLRSNSTELRIHAISAGYEDTKEAWIQAGLDYKAGIGAYETVTAPATIVVVCPLFLYMFRFRL